MRSALASITFIRPMVLDSGEFMHGFIGEKYVINNGIGL
jgi:hypothetical protein